MENERSGTGSGLSRVRTLLGRLGKFRYAALVLLAGAALMLFPAKSTSSDTARQSETQEVASLSAVQEELAALLSRVDGAGRVEVMLSLEYGAEQFYQADVQESTQNGDSERQSETVFYQPQSAQKLPVVTRVRYPVYKGAVVVCEGAERASVRLAIVQAVSRLTGLGSDKISVMKMKHQ